MKKIVKIFLILSFFVLLNNAKAVENPNMEILEIYDDVATYSEFNGTYNVNSSEINIDYRINNMSSDYCLAFNQITYLNNVIDLHGVSIVCNYNIEDTYTFYFTEPAYMDASSKTNTLEISIVPKDELPYITCEDEQDWCEEGIPSFVEELPQGISKIDVDTLVFFNIKLDNLNKIEISNYKMYDANNNEVVKEDNKYKLLKNSVYYIEANISNFSNDYIYDSTLSIGANDEAINIDLEPQLVNNKIKYIFSTSDFPYQDTMELSTYIFDSDMNFSVLFCETFDYQIDNIVSWKIGAGIESLWSIVHENNIDINDIQEIVFNNKIDSHITYVTGEAIDLSMNNDGSVLMFFENNKLYIEFEGILKLNENSSRLFSSFLVEHIRGLEYLDTSSVTDMSMMFEYNTELKELDLSTFNTSNVTNMSAMFSHCNSLETLDLSSFNTSKVTDMSLMFMDCKSLETLNLSNFNTSNVTNMRYMFDYCINLETLNLSNFNTSKVTDMNSMFMGCKSLEALNISSFDTSEVTDMSFMFDEVNNIRELDLTNFDTRKVGSQTTLIFNNMQKLEKIYVSNKFLVNNYSGFIGYCPLLAGGNGTTFESIQCTDNQCRKMYNVIDSIEQPGLFSYKYDIYGLNNYVIVNNKYINVKDGNFDGNSVTATNNVDVVYENNNIKFLYDNITLKSIDIVKYSSQKYDLTNDYIDTGDEEFDLSNIDVTNATKNYENGVFEIKYGDDVLENYKIYSNVKLNKYNYELYFNEGVLSDDTITVINPDMYGSNILSAVSSNTGIATATIEDNKVIINAVESGIATITITLQNGKSAQANVRVYNRIVNSISAEITEYSKDASDDTFNLNIIADKGADAPDIVYTNNFENVVTVDNDGNVTLVGPGIAMIAVSCGGKGLIITINVSAHIKSISIDGPEEFELDKYQTVSVSFNPTNTDDNKSIVWSVSDDTILELDSSCLAGSSTCGIKALKKGSATITARSSNNKTATLDVTVDDFKAPNFDYVQATVSKDNKVISRIPIDTDINVLISMIINNESVKIYDINNQIKESGVFVTGDKLKYLNSQKQEDYYDISVYGDVSGDGKITPLDYVKIKNHIMEEKTITSMPFLLAADYDNDGEIAPLDYVKIKNYIMRQELVGGNN